MRIFDEFRVVLNREVFVTIKTIRIAPGPMSVTIYGTVLVRNKLIGSACVIDIYSFAASAEEIKVYRRERVLIEKSGF